MKVLVERSGRILDEVITYIGDDYESVSYDKSGDEEEIIKMAEDTVLMFNNTLREGESSRKLVSVYYKE